MQRPFVAEALEEKQLAQVSWLQGDKAELEAS